MTLTPEQIKKMDEIAGVERPTPTTKSGSVGFSEADRIRQKYGVTETPQEDKGGFRKFLEGVGDFTGISGFGKSLAVGADAGKRTKQVEKQLNEAMGIQTNLLAKIKEKRASGEDTTRLMDALEQLSESIQKMGGSATDFATQGLKDEEVIGSALKFASTVIGAGTLPGAGFKTLGAQTFKEGLKTGAIQGAKTGALFGGLSGAGQEIEDSNIDSILGEGGYADKFFRGAVKGGATGALTGAVIGGLVGGVTGGLRGRALRNKILDTQQNLGQKTKIVIDDLPPADKKTIEIARTQGFDDRDIEFLRTMDKTDKKTAQNMINIAEKASKDRRVIERPIDVVGKNFTDRISFASEINKKAGSAVDEAAKALKGQPIQEGLDTLQENIIKKLENSGVGISPEGKLDFTNSVFKNTPAIQKELQKVISTIPDGSDAYQLHIFKKTIDEMVEYGTKGEGLKGQGKNILKGIRSSVDDLLDNTFESYNKANTDFRLSREMLDVAEELFGKAGIESKERGGQLLRSVFSNTTQRPRVLQFAANLDEFAKNYGKKFDGNLVDQTMFTELLEDVYGTQATTSLQGQVERAVKNANKVTTLLRDPIKGVGELAAEGYEKIAGVSDETRKKILFSLLNQ